MSGMTSKEQQELAEVFARAMATKYPEWQNQPPYERKAMAAGWFLGFGLDSFDAWTMANEVTK